MCYSRQFSGPAHARTAGAPTGMVYKCSAFGCKSGYASQASSSDVKPTFHTYPLRNKQLLALWLERNPRRNFTPSKYSRLCSLHFKESDFITTSQDSNPRRRRRDGAASLKVRYLKPDAVPSVFANPFDFSLRAFHRRKNTINPPIFVDSDRVKITDASTKKEDFFFFVSCLLLS